MQRKIILGLIVLLVAVSFSGCTQVNYNLNEQVEFLPESGAAQYVMCQSLAKAIDEISFQKYARKKVYLVVTGGTGYTQHVALELVTGKLLSLKAKILPQPTDDQKNQGVKKEPGDYELKVAILTSGVHSYDGIIWRNIVGLAMIGLDETDKDGRILHHTGNLQRYQYKGWILSTYFIIAGLAFILLLATTLLQRGLSLQKKRNSLQ